MTMLNVFPTVGHSAKKVFTMLLQGSLIKWEMHQFWSYMVNTDF